MIDNYDSFTYSLVRYFKELGVSVMVVRHDQFAEADIERWQPNYLVISPGPGLPSETGKLLSTVRSYFRRVPILGVCLGHQALAQAFGGNLIPAREIFHGKSSVISHSECGLFQNLSGPIQVARYHSWVVDPGSLPCDWVVNAWTERNGKQDEIMAIAHRQWPCFGVQFHPESILSQQGKSLLSNFLAHRSGWQQIR